VRRGLTRSLRVLAAVALAAYPILVWRGLLGTSPRVVALGVLCILVPAAFVRRSTGPARGLALVPLVTIDIVSLAGLLNSLELVLLVPIAINATLLTAFASSLRRGATPFVERFARLQETHLTDEQVAWCRRWTAIWCAFFATNGSIAVLLAWLAPLAWWAFYNGFLAYILIGTLIALEWILRVRRFPRDA
jgi:uncharacterized membrane protein